jgi:hypothetical protein
VAHWTLISVTIQFLFAASIYFCAVFVTPEKGVGTDMEAFYWEQRRTIVLCELVTCLLSLLANTAFLQTASAGLFLKENLLILPFLVVLGVQFALPARRVQWACSSARLAAMLLFTTVFTDSLN